MKNAIALLILVMALTVGVVPSGTALTHVNRTVTRDNFLRPVRFEDDGDSGLLTDVWINGSGPFNFAIDTGAGITIITRRVATQARLSVQRASRPLVGGLSAATITSNEEARQMRLAIGDDGNLMPSPSVAAVVDRLPGDIDGILDPIDAFKPLGVSIDLSNRTLAAFEPATSGLKGAAVPRDGALVRWIREAGSHKPFVRLSNGDLALLDTGSGFGFAFGANRAPGRIEKVRNVNDLGSSVRSKKVAPLTINVGDLELRNVPTDVLHGAAADIPSILGRRALHPFKLTFDPVARLIAIEPSR